jgi:hypothetical protein
MAPAPKAEHPQGINLITLAVPVTSGLRPTPDMSPRSNN